MAHLTLWSRSARPGSDLPWTIERTYASHYIASMGVPIDGSTVTLEGRLWIALPVGSEPSSPSECFVERGLTQDIWGDCTPYGPCPCTECRILRAECV